VQHPQSNLIVATALRKIVVYLITKGLTLDDEVLIETFARAIRR